MIIIIFIWTLFVYWITETPSKVHSGLVYTLIILVFHLTPCRNRNTMPILNHKGTTVTCMNFKYTDKGKSLRNWKQQPKLNMQTWLIIHRKFKKQNWVLPPKVSSQNWESHKHRNTDKDRYCLSLHLVAVHVHLNFIS